jgi:hypothetical protein
MENLLGRAAASVFILKQKFWGLSVSIIWVDVKQKGIEPQVGW